MKESKLNPREITYNPIKMAPQTPEEARQFVEKFHGRRPPAGHSLDFDRLEVPEAYVVLTQLNRSVFPDIDNLWQLMNRIVIPTIPLTPGGGSLTDPDNRKNRRLTTSDIPLFFNNMAGLDENTVSDFKANITLVLYKDPSNLWKISPIMIPDSIKPVQQLKKEIFTLKNSSNPSTAQDFRRSMKELLYYLLTGEQYA